MTTHVALARQLQNGSGDYVVNVRRELPVLEQGSADFGVIEPEDGPLGIDKGHLFGLDEGEDPEAAARRS